MSDIDNNQDMIDSRDIIARIEELEGQDERDAEEAAELKILKALEEECSGAPDWRHGETLIRESYFTDYQKQFADEIGAVPKDFPSWIVIDWEVTADNVKVDYVTVDYDGVEYLIRSC